jgi:hypothetical protein
MVFALSGFVLSLREQQRRPLHIAFAAIVVGITYIIVAWPGWWGGHCFGPRLMTDVVPFLVYFVAFNFHMPAEISQWARTCLSASIAIFAIVGVLIHAQGALRYGPWEWNYIPHNIDNRLPRLGLEGPAISSNSGATMTLSLHGAAGKCGKIAYVYRKVQDR